MVEIILSLVYFIIAVTAIVYAANRHYVVRELRNQIEENRADYWFKVSVKLADELNRLGKHDIVSGILSDELERPEKKKELLGDITVPDCLPEDF